MTIEAKDASIEFLIQYSELLLNEQVSIPDFGQEKGDKWLAIEISLRGRNEQDFFDIVHGLFQAYSAEADEKMKDEILSLTNGVMSIGERNLGIDWS